MAIQLDPLKPGDKAFALTNTFIESLDTAKYFERRGYGLMTSPNLNPGQVLTTQLKLAKEASSSAEVALCVGVFNEDDQTVVLHGPTIQLAPGETQILSWQVPSTDGYPISSTGIEISSASSDSTILMDYFDWQGMPEFELGRRKGTMWGRAWVNAVDTYHPFYPESFRLIHNKGTGLLLYGSRDWSDYSVEADVTPHLVKRSGIAARTQGLRRYYGLVLTEKNQIQLIKELDGTKVLDEAAFDVEFGTTYLLKLAVKGESIDGYVNGEKLVSANDASLTQGGVALVIDEGRTATQKVSISKS